jgi:hypothetical protein
MLFPLWYFDFDFAVAFCSEEGFLVVFAFLEKNWMELSGAVPACSEDQHFKILYLYVAGSVLILWSILIARGIRTEEESTTVRVGTVGGFN